MEEISKAPVPPPKRLKPKALVDPNLCTGCEICVAFCPVDCIYSQPAPEYPHLRQVVWVEQETCISCTLCERYCPWDAIKMVIPENVPSSANP